MLLIAPDLAMLAFLDVQQGWAVPENGVLFMHPCLLLMRYAVNWSTGAKPQHAVCGY
jgi:hypothetical protein